MSSRVTRPAREDRGESAGTLYGQLPEHVSILNVEPSDEDDARPGRVTIRQVAELAGVSIATVSRVVNGRSDVSVQTRDTVRRVIREHGYLAGARSRPEPAALIRIMVPEVHSNYFAEIVAGASEALYEHDLRVELCPARHPRAPGASLPDRLADGAAEGAILVLPPDRPEDEFEALAGQGFPFVIVDPGTEIAEGIPVVSAAHASGATQATAHLLELGHRRIGAIGGPEGRLATHERLRGYHAALAGAGVLPDPCPVPVFGFQRGRWPGGGGLAAAPAGSADGHLRVQRRDGDRGDAGAGRSRPSGSGRRVRRRF